MNWITWEKIGIDRMACAWLINKYIDQNCNFTFIPSGANPSDYEGTPFDIPGVKLSHRRGHCTFYAFIKDYNISDPIVIEMCKIIDGVDTLLDISIPVESIGIDALCVGIRLLTNDDHKTLENGKLLFDALYCYLKNKSI